MAAKRRAKSSRMLGSGTYGWGKNKHRNSGSRGGFGNAGTGKKSHNKKPSIWSDPTYFGKHGFVRHGVHKTVNAINLRDIDERLARWVQTKDAVVENGMVVLDVGKLGFEKVLSGGKLSKKVKLLAPAATAGVAEKVKAAGGELVVKQA